MDRFPGILFKVQARHADLLGRAIGEINLDHAFADDRVQELGNLIALR